MIFDATPRKVVQNQIGCMPSSKTYLRMFLGSIYSHPMNSDIGQKSTPVDERTIHENGDLKML